MKKISEKDLSLDKQEVSNLSGNTETRDLTNNEIICASKVCTESHYEICCDYTQNNCLSVDPKCPTLDNCPESDDETGCAISENNLTECITPIPETQHC